MKKMIFFLLLSSCIAISGYSRSNEKQPDVNNLKNVVSKKQVSNSDVKSRNYFYGAVNTTQELIKPYWECWAFNIPGCASGWSCAENIQVATAQVAAILINYCINGGGFANCQ